MNFFAVYYPQKSKNKGYEFAAALESVLKGGKTRSERVSKSLFCHPHPEYEVYRRVRVAEQAKNFSTIADF